MYCSQEAQDSVFFVHETINLLIEKLFSFIIFVGRKVVSVFKTDAT